MTQPFDIGEIAFARQDIFNDGSMPETPQDALLAAAGTRGVIVQIGYMEAEDVEIYLVRFEDENLVLGPPVGCLVDELTQDEDEARRLRLAA